MGLFSSTKKTYVNTAVVRLVEDNMLPNSVKTGAFKSIFEEGDMTEYILEELVHNVANNASRMYKWAKNNSHIGVPRKLHIPSNAKQEAVERILTTLYGAGELEYYYFGVPSFYHFGWETLVANGYNTETNLYSPGVWMDYFSLELDNQTKDEYTDGIFRQEGMSPYGGYKPWNPALDLIEGSVVPPVNLMEQDIDPRIVVNLGSQPDPLKPSDVEYSKVTLNLPMFEDEDYFQACWKVGNKRFYWSYKKNFGTYLELDLIGNQSEGLGTYYPVVHFVANKVFIGDDTTSQDYKVNNKLCKYLGIDMQEIWDGMKENDSIDELNQAALMMATPANTTSEVEQRYAFDFFDSFVSIGNPSNGPALTADTLFDRQLYVAGNAVGISDLLFNMSISFGGITKQRKSGKIGEVGEHASSVGQGEFNLDVRNPLTGIVTKLPRRAFVNTYQRQVAINLYDEIQVTDLRSAYSVIGRYATQAEGGDLRVVLPLDKSIVDTYPVTVREQLVARSLNFVFNSYQVVTVQFYQRGVFKNLLTVVAIVIAIWTAGTGSGFSAAIAAGGTIALAAIWSTLIVPLLQVALIQEAATVFVKLFGEEFATLVAVIAVAYGAYSNITNSSSIFADTLIRVGNSLISSVNEAMQRSIQEVLDETSEFDDYAQNMYEKLEQTAQDLLGDNSVHNLPQIVVGELPQDYYRRTVHSGNIGTKSIEATTSYVALALRLPTFNETYGVLNGIA